MRLISFPSPLPLLVPTLIINSFSIIALVSAENWLTAWVFIEIGLYSFIPILMFTNKHIGFSTQSRSAIIYFLSQTFGSLIFLIRILYLNYNPSNTAPLIVSALLIKLAASPYHSWLPPACAQITWPALFWLLTIQKLPALVILHILNTTLITNKLIYLISISVILSATLGGLGALGLNRLKPLLAYSSINQTAWIIIASLHSFQLILLYFTAYTLTLLPIILIINHYAHTNINSAPILNNISIPTKALLTINFINLAGIPPTLIFALKTQLLASIEASMLNYWIFSALILGVVITTYFYAQYSIIIFLTPLITPKILLKQKYPPLTLYVTLLLLLGPIILILGNFLFYINSLIKTRDFHPRDSLRINIIRIA